VGDIVAMVYDIEEPFSVYMSYEVANIEQAKKKAEEAAWQYLGTEQSQPVKWVKTV
jgi:C1A family cysteine protease